MTNMAVDKVIADFLGEKPLTVKRVTNYLREWTGYKAVRKTGEDESHYYFTA